MTRLTAPGKTDLHFMVVTCTPSDTAVEFCETSQEASDAAKVNLGAPGASVYMGTIQAQGEHRTRSSAAQVAIVVPVDAELRRILRARYGAATRADLVACITRLVACTIAELRAARSIPSDLGGVSNGDEAAFMRGPTRASDPRAHLGQSSDDEHTHDFLLETMSCGCPVGLHEPRRNIHEVSLARESKVCALGWPLSWRAGVR